MTRSIEEMTPAEKEHLALCLALALWEIGPVALFEKLKELIAQQGAQNSA